MKVNTCEYCGHIGPDVNRVNYYYIGGKGDIPYPVCGDKYACIKRMTNPRYDAATSKQLEDKNALKQDELVSRYPHLFRDKED